MIMPALRIAGVLVFFLGFEVFGLVLVLGDPEGHLVLSTYLYKLTNKLGTPSYHLMAAVAVCLVAVTMPLVMLQRWLLQVGQQVRRRSRARARARSRCRWANGSGWPFACIAAWLVVHGRGADLRHRAALVRQQLGRGREAGRRADARSTSATSATSRRWCAASSTRC